MLCLYSFPISLAMLKVHCALGRNAKCHLMKRTTIGKDELRGTTQHPARQGAHNQCPAQRHTYLICWRGSFWRGLAAGSGLLCSRTAAFPAWLWKDTTLEKKTDFSSFFPIPLWLKQLNCSSQDGQTHEISSQRLPKHSAMQSEKLILFCGS